jgi:hypothetical protein
MLNLTDRVSHPHKTCLPYYTSLHSRLNIRIPSPIHWLCNQTKSTDRPRRYRQCHVCTTNRRSITLVSRHVLNTEWRQVTNFMEQRPSWVAKNVISYSRNSPNFMEPERSSPYSQQPASCPYPEPDQSSLCTHPTSRKFILILSSHLRLGLPSGLRFPH